MEPTRKRTALEETRTIKFDQDLSKLNIFTRISPYYGISSSCYFKCKNNHIVSLCCSHALKHKSCSYCDFHDRFIQKTTKIYGENRFIYKFTEQTKSSAYGYVNLTCTGCNIEYRASISSLYRKLFLVCDTPNCKFGKKESAYQTAKRLYQMFIDAKVENEYTIAISSTGLIKGVLVRHKCGNSYLIYIIERSNPFCNCLFDSFS